MDERQIARREVMLQPAVERLHAEYRRGDLTFDEYLAELHAASDRQAGFVAAADAHPMLRDKEVPY